MSTSPSHNGEPPSDKLTFDELTPDEQRRLKSEAERGEREGFRFFIFGCAFFVAVIVACLLVLLLWLRAENF
jgi:hypothetical protein